MALQKIEITGNPEKLKAFGRRFRNHCKRKGLTLEIISEIEKQVKEEPKTIEEKKGIIEKPKKKASKTK